MSPVSVEHDDQYRRDLGRLHEASDAERCVIDEFGVELEGTGAALARSEEAIERVHRAWDAGFRDAITRLDQIPGPGG